MTAMQARPRPRITQLVSNLILNTICSGHYRRISDDAADRLAVWATTLRQYQQGHGRLRREDESYCCLGVWCAMRELPVMSSAVAVRGAYEYVFPRGTQSATTLEACELARWLELELPADESDPCYQFQLLLMGCNDKAGDGKFTLVRCILEVCSQKRAIPNEVQCAVFTTMIGELYALGYDLDAAYTPEVAV